MNHPTLYYESSLTLRKAENRLNHISMRKICATRSKAEKTGIGWSDARDFRCFMGFHKWGILKMVGLCCFISEKILLNMDDDWGDDLELQGHRFRRGRVPRVGSHPSPHKSPGCLRLRFRGSLQLRFFLMVRGTSHSLIPLM